MPTTDGNLYQYWLQHVWFDVLYFLDLISVHRARCLLYDIKHLYQLFPSLNALPHSVLFLATYYCLSKSQSKVYIFR